MTTGDEPDTQADDGVAPEANQDPTAGNPTIEPSGPGRGAANPGGHEPETQPDRQTDNEVVDDLVGGLFREVDDRFSHLEASYQLARQDLTAADVEDSLPGLDPIAASAARYELVSEAASLRADVERQAGELDERDRMLSDLSNRIVGFEDKLAEAAKAEQASEGVRQELHEERRELARVRALLDARAAERQELADLAQRLQNEKDHLDTLLGTAMQRFEDVDRVKAELGENLARLEAARHAEASEHEGRYHDLVDARAQVRKLTELVDELTVARDEANRRADKVESKVERRGNEVNYLNRRIESLTEKANQAEMHEAEVKRLTEEHAVMSRQVGDLEREVENKTAQAAAAAAAVEAIADRSSQHDDLVARIAELEEAAARRNAAMPAETDRTVSELQNLAVRARELGARRTSGAYESLASESGAFSEAAESAPQTPAPASVPVAATPSTTAPVEQPAEEPQPAPEPLAPVAPVLEVPPMPVAEPVAQPTPAPMPPAVPAAPVLDVPVLDVPDAAAVAPTAPALDIPAMPEPPAPAAPALSLDDSATMAPAAPAVDFAVGSRHRLVLPPNMDPDTPAAVAHLLAQPGVTAIVDARSFCGRTGVRPSELFERMQALRDQFDVPVEVVVTPVSTPVGGAPSLPAIGVHVVSGADTVSDRVRALCIGFPPDQPLVVVAGDDHVRRAAIGEEANVVDPAVVLDIT